jgi:PAS domain S-box-containing protein
MEKVWEGVLLQILEKYKDDIIKSSANWAHNRNLEIKGRRSLEDVLRFCSELYTSYVDILRRGDYTQLNNLIKTTVDALGGKRAKVSAALMAFLSFKRGVEPVVLKACKNADHRAEIVSRLAFLFEYSVFKISTLLGEKSARLRARPRRPEDVGEAKPASPSSDIALAAEAGIYGETVALYAAMVENAADGIVVVQDGMLKYVNNASLGLMGLTPEELIQSELLKLITRKNWEMLVKRYDARMAGQEIPNCYEIGVSRKDGSKVTVELTAARMLYKGRSADLVFIRDITPRKRIEEELHQSRERLELALRGADLGMWDSNLETGEVFFDGRWSEMLGYEPEEFEPRYESWMELVHPDDLPRVRQTMQDHLESLTAYYETEHRLRAKSGEWRWVLDRGKVVEWGLDGRPLRATGTHQDITDRKLAEEELRKLSLAVEQSPSLVVITDPEGNIQYVNPKFTVVTGYTTEEIVGQNAGILGEQSEEDQTAMWENLSTGREWHGEFCNRKENGAIYWEAASISSIKDAEGRITHYVKVAEDITERKRAEAKLRETMEDLARSNKDLEQFAYVASHDLQEPLRVVTSYLQLLERKYKEQLGGDAVKYITASVDAAARMKNLIDGLLSYSRVGTQAKPYEPTDVEAVLEQSLVNLGATLEESGAEVTHDALPTVMADATQLVQLFQNLISNAIKFRREASPRVHVSVEAREREWVFSVQDNGIGIEPQYADRIFKIFKRLHTRTEYPGTGIGLAICKKIVERHGGTIEMKGKPGEGSTFIFTMPVIGGSTP